MTWSLEIHQIDVSWGDSALVVAREHNTNGTLNRIRTMLIDGGLPEYAPTVNLYISSVSDVKKIDKIVVTHYDKDHYGGIQNLLLAENCRIVAFRIAAACVRAVGACATQGHANAEAAAAGAAVAAAFGATDAMIQAIARKCQDSVDVASAISAATRRCRNPKDGSAFGSALLSTRGPNFKSFCESAAEMSNSGTPARRELRTAAALLRLLLKSNSLPLMATESRYIKSTIIDPGDITDSTKKQVDAPQAYRNAIAGRYKSGSSMFSAPGGARSRVTPDLGEEILWGAGADAEDAPDGAPRVFVLAANAEVWKEPSDEPMAGNPGNVICLGLIIKFNNFHFYTGGDLPLEGEDLVLKAVLQNRLPGATSRPKHICGFKVGHHGSDTCTSKSFVRDIRAAGALISTGGQQHKLPTQVVLNRLASDSDIQAVYLTNCNLPREGVPATMNAAKQFGANAPANVKVFVAGDNNEAGQPAPARRHVNRGNIKIIVSEAQSLAWYGASNNSHSFDLHYWEEDLHPPAVRAVAFPH